jgi:O-acetyl-ADP-ribose deacetylase (regulator of RNase III)
MGTQRAYHIAGNRLTIDIGSVLDVSAEVVVSSDDYRLTMGGGVSAAIRMAAGSALALDAAKAVPRKAGDVVVTTAGALPSRYVFHVVTIGPREDPSAVPDVAGLVRRATRMCLELMQPLSVRSIVFPALGTGFAGFPIEASAVAMAEVVNDVLRQTSWPTDVSIMLMSRTLASPMEYLAFYEEFARRVPLVVADEITQPEPARPGQPPPVVSDLLDLEQQRQKLEQELIDLRGKEDPAREAQLWKALGQNTDQRLRAAQREQSSRQNAAKVFVSYARDDRQLYKRLSDHLGGLRHGGYICEWSDGQIIPGQEWAPEIIRQLDEADIILLLITSSFLGSEFIGRVELTRALERHRGGEAIVIPVILKPADWQSAGLEGLQALPKDGKPASTWPDRDAAYVDIAQGLRRAVDTWRASQR